jgi:hypothetical protein
MRDVRLTICWALSVFFSACTAKIPQPWAKLGVPGEGLDRIQQADGDRLRADYRGCTAEQLLARIDSVMLRAGYAQACNIFEGRVRGYAKDADKLLVKVDSIGPVAALSVGNKAGSDRLLYGVCFEGYRLEGSSP